MIVVIRTINMAHKRAVLFLIIFLSFFSKTFCKPVYITTGFPLASILREVVGTYGDVINLVPPGASPHTYAALPSDVKKTQGATALFYVSRELDGWAANLPASKKYSLLDFIPKNYILTFPENSLESDSKHNHSSGVTDPHFWTDPLTVKSMIPKLTETLSKLDPANEKNYKSNAEKFMRTLDWLNKQVESALSNVKGKTVFLFHPSFLYMLKRYGLVYGGAIEIDPGVEPSAKYTIMLTKKIKSSGAKAIFTEPQLPDAPAKTISNATGMKVYSLDPNGGVKGRYSYSEIILYNANVLKSSLQY